MKFNPEDFPEDFNEMLGEALMKVQNEIMAIYLKEITSTLKAMEEGAPKTMEELNSFEGTVVTEASTLAQMSALTPADTQSLCNVHMLLPALTGLHLTRLAGNFEKAAKEKDLKEYYMIGEVTGFIFRAGIAAILFPDSGHEAAPPEQYRDIIKKCNRISITMRPVFDEIYRRTRKKMTDKLEETIDKAIAQIKERGKND